MMNRDEATDIIAAARAGAALVVGPGANGGLLFGKGDEPASIYNMDMAYATPIALGAALARPKRRILAVEGDGSFYAGSTVLSTVWRMRPANLTIVVVDNGVWGTGDGKEPTATSSGVVLSKLALAAGWTEDRVVEADQPEPFRLALTRALSTDGPYFIVCKTDPAQDKFLGSAASRPYTPRHMLDSAILMRMDLCRDG